MRPSAKSRQAEGSDQIRHLSRKAVLAQNLMPSLRASRGHNEHRQPESARCPRKIAHLHEIRARRHVKRQFRILKPYPRRPRRILSIPGCGLPKGLSGVGQASGTVITGEIRYSASVGFARSKTKTSPSSVGPALQEAFTNSRTCKSTGTVSPHPIVRVTKPAAPPMVILTPNVPWPGTPPPAFRFAACARSGYTTASAAEQTP
jgi:hypothetical protein